LELGAGRQLARSSWSTGQGVCDVFLKQFFSGLGNFGTQPLNYVQTKEAFFRYNDQKKRR
jgi:hypothetical protein